MVFTLFALFVIISIHRMLYGIKNTWNLLVLSKKTEYNVFAGFSVYELEMFLERIM